MRYFEYMTKLFARLEKSRAFWFLTFTLFGFFLLRLPSFFEPYWYGSSELTQVKPQEEYVLKDEQPGWFEITLKDGTFGWISSQYAKKE